MNPILAKIKKLLRLANDRAATPAEAASALAKAMELAAEIATDRQTESYRRHNEETIEA